LMLHAHQLVFNHPITSEKITMNATVNDEFKRVGDILNFDLSLYS
jgi:tRNA pseudouridine65 synthase